MIVVTNVSCAQQLGHETAAAAAIPGPSSTFDDSREDTFSVSDQLHDDAPETLTTTVLSTDVELELTPTSFTWDPGDGTDAITSTEPGAPYPDDTITHVYKKVGEYRITLTTTWEGRFRIAGTDTWHPITGTGSTTHTTDPFETREIRSVLS